jgi:hypothetical protein
MSDDLGRACAELAALILALVPALSRDGAGVTARARAAPARSPRQTPAGARSPGVPAACRAAAMTTAPPQRSCRSKKPWTSRPYRRSRCANTAAAPHPPQRKKVAPPRSWPAGSGLAAAPGPGARPQWPARGRPGRFTSS